MRYSIQKDRLFITGLAGCLITLVAASTAQAVPALQIYLEGGTYDTVTESWIVQGTDSFTVWAIGNVDGSGGVGALADVRMSIAYASVASAADTPSILLTPTTTDGFGGFTDPSEPTGTGTWIQTVTDSSTPVLGDGSSLASHGIFGAGTDWQEFALGDFTLTDSPIADFITAFPSAPAETSGQINAYDVTISNADGIAAFHIDLYDTIVASGHAKFAPFSHDGTAVPVPGSTVLCILGLGFISAFIRRRGA